MLTTILVIVSLNFLSSCLLFLQYMKTIELTEEILYSLQTAPERRNEESEITADLTARMEHLQRMKFSNMTSPKERR